MLRTNTKKYQENFRKYIFDAIDPEVYGKKISTLKGKLDFLFETFKDEYECKYIKMAKPRLEDRLAGWLSGAPSVINIPFYNVEILELARDLAEATDHEIAAKEQRIISGYYNFMAGQIIKLKNKC